jgi:hypothetical protein
MDPRLPMESHHDEHRHREGLTAGRVAFGVFLAIALFFLFTEHRAHLYGALPYLFVLACPLMHLFHHHGHGGHHHAGSDRRPGGSERDRP